MQAYDSLAAWFEYLNDDCDYVSWSQYFIQGLSSRGAGNSGLELGCGSGAFCRALSEAGYQMQGADLSPSMLSKAQSLAREKGMAINFFLADAANFSLPKKVDFILSPNDCYNYISPEKLGSAFLHAAAALKKRGIFWFDISSAYKLRKKIADNMFADDRENVTYLCFSRLLPDRVEMDVTLFVRRHDGAFDRFDERHTQYIHEEAEVCERLRAAGFRILSVEGHLGESKEKIDRLNFICQKQ